MDFIKKYPLQIVAGIAILLFFLLRFYNILHVPLFTDEAIYLRWAQIAKNDANWRFISLTDGKQPSYIWFTMLSMRFFEDPLLAGRVVSVIAGFFTMIGIFLTARELFNNKWVGLIVGLLYLIYPMAFVYDRMALYDGLVATFSVWSLYLTILLVRKIRLDIALLLGMVTGGAVLTKTTGFGTLYLLPFSLILFDFSKKERMSRLFKWALLVVLVAILANGFYAILRLSPFFHIINEKNGIFFYPPGEWIKHPFAYFMDHWLAQWDWLVRYFTWPILLLAPASFFAKKAQLREKLFLLFWFFIPFTFLALFGNTIYPRFIFFMTMPLLLLAAYTFFEIRLWIKKPLLLVTCYLLLVSLQVQSDYLILTDFAHAPLPVSDLGQYYNGWPAGVGIKESVAFFKGQAKDKKIYIGTQGTFGLMPYAYELYLVSNPNVTIVGYWPTTETVPAPLRQISETKPTYFVFYQPCPACEQKKGIAPSTWKNITQVYQANKVEKDSFLTVYQIQPGT